MTSRGLKILQLAQCANAEKSATEAKKRQECVANVHVPSDDTQQQVYININ